MTRSEPPPPFVSLATAMERVLRAMAAMLRQNHAAAGEPTNG